MGLLEIFVGILRVKKSTVKNGENTECHCWGSFVWNQGFIKLEVASDLGLIFYGF